MPIDCSTHSTLDYLDRNNISAARLKGLQADLKLSDTQYATCLSILYAGYILMQVPSNMIVNRISRPSIYIGCAVSASTIVTLWLGLMLVDDAVGLDLHFVRRSDQLRRNGGDEILFGLCGGSIPSRCSPSAFEGSSDPPPGLASLVDQDQWYTRRELTLRNAILFGGEYSTTHVSDNL